MSISYLNIGPNRDHKIVKSAWDHLSGLSVNAGDRLILKLDDGDYYKIDGQDTLNHRDGARVELEGNLDYPERVRLHYRNGSYRCTGIYVDQGHRLGGINGMSLICDGQTDPPDMHAMGVFAYYGAGIHCGPELKENYGSQTRLTISGFTVGLCASKNANLQADGALVLDCPIGALAGHHGVIHFANGELWRTGEELWHLYGYSDGEVYVDGLRVMDDYFHCDAMYGAQITGGGVMAPPVGNWTMDRFCHGWMSINGLIFD